MNENMAARLGRMPDEASRNRGRSAGDAGRQGDAVEFSPLRVVGIDGLAIVPQCDDQDVAQRFGAIPARRETRIRFPV